MEASSAASASHGWSWIYRAGGAAALFGVAIIPVQLAVFIAWGQPDTARGWFELFQSNSLAGLLAFEGLFVVNAVVGLATTLALYVVLRRINESLMAIALALGVVEAGAFVVARPALEMLSLSEGYAAANTEAQRELFLAAGEAMLATFDGTAFHVGYNIFSVFFLLVSLVMLQGDTFGRATAYAGIAAAILNWGLYVPEMGVLLSALSVIPLALWNILVARRLFRLGRSFSKEEASRT